ncbi:MAG: substrate-binding domain-containing protein, partial [Firmicutes bacterium]|nr:substrate-binding domain-containing protein [Bacillota bacterium]
FQSLSQSDYSGAIVYPVDNEFYSEDLLKLSLAHFPLVIVDRKLKGINFAYVAMDNYKAMVDAVKFLHDKKYKNIVYITPPSSLATSAEERIAGYGYGLRKYYGAVKANNFLEIKPDNHPAIRLSLVKYLKKFQDTEVVILTGVQATTALQAAADLNIPVPHKLRLMIIDNELSDTEKAAIRPYIIEVDSYEMGFKAATALYNQIYGDLRIVSEKLPAKIIDSAITVTE